MKTRKKTKVCKTCQKTKPLSEFHSTGYYRLASGERKKTYKPSCKDCSNAAWKERIDAMLDELVEWKCEACGYDRCKAAIELHHRESEKKEFTIASRWSVSFEKLEEEVKKCDVLCCRCHRELHAGIEIYGPVA